MKTVRVYKISVRENILRQMIFTDRNLFLIGCGIIAFTTWRIADTLPVDIRLFIILILCGALILISSIQIDRQPLLFLTSRIVSYLISTKKQRF